MITLRQTSKISLFLFLLNYNYIFLRLIIFPYMYVEYSYMAYLYIAIIIVILLLLFLFIPKVVYKTNLNEKYKNSKFKHIYNIILLLKNILYIYIGSLLIQRIDYDMLSIYYFIIAISITVLLVSRLKSNDVIELSTLFVMAAIGIYMLAFLHMVDVDFSGLRSFKFKLPNVPFYLILLSIFSDNLLVLLTDKTNMKFNKSTIILPLITQFIFMMFEIYQMLLSAGDKLFLDYEFIGFISLSFQTTSNYIGNLNFVYLYILTMATIINTSFSFSIIKESYNLKKNIIVDIFLLIIMISSMLLINNLDFSFIVNILLYVSSFGIILFIWLIKEIYNVRKTKK